MKKKKIKISSSSYLKKNIYFSLGSFDYFGMEYTLEKCSKSS